MPLSQPETLCRLEVAAPADVPDLHSVAFLHDRGDGAVVTSASTLQPDQLIAERFADPLRVVGQRAEDELDEGGPSSFFGQAV